MKQIRKLSLQYIRYMSSKNITGLRLILWKKDRIDDISESDVWLTNKNCFRSFAENIFTPINFKGIDRIRIETIDPNPFECMDLTISPED